MHAHTYTPKYRYICISVLATCLTFDNQILFSIYTGNLSIS